MALILFPTDLFKNLPPGLDVILIEEELFFNRNTESLGRMKFNILKPIYHRATMKHFTSLVSCTYMELGSDWVSAVRKLYKGKSVSFFNPTNRYLISKILKLGDSCVLHMLDTPRFILREVELKKYTGPQVQTSFYRWMRNKYNILSDIGGKLTYDKENREGPSKNMERDLPEEYRLSASEMQFVKEAIKYVAQAIPNGDLITWNDGVKLKFPISRRGALKVLNQFIKEKLTRFGTYQDAIVIGSSFMYHAALSPMLNIGLITPVEVIQSVIKQFSAMTARMRATHIHNVEGFVRQIIGWREYCRYTYSRNDPFVNVFKMSNPLSAKWYSSFGIEPVDACIAKAFKYGYLHHTERLMICANFMLYFNTDPHAIYRWFMEFALDSYDWVMDFNVFKMVCYSGTSKPYICSSRYLLKMSNIPRGPWCQKWDYMFWHFIHTHRTEIKKIYRLLPLVKFASAKLIELKAYKDLRICV